MSILELDKIRYSYKSGRNILKDISMKFEVGKLYAILGSSGAGKSTLLSLLAGLDEPSGGKILFKYKDIKENGYAFHRRNNISLVFQNYNLIDYLTPIENIRIVNSKANKIDLEVLGLTNEEVTRNVLHLSGGQQQRVAIARALVANSPIILADEPTGNLDSDTADEIVEILKSSAHDSGKCVIVVTHSKDMVKQADVVLRLKGGQLTQV